MLKLLVEFGPIIVFFATYKFSDIFVATLLMLLVTMGGLAISYLIDRKISMPLLISGTVLFLTGMITLISGNPMFIKMKPTIVYFTFASILLYGYYKNNGLMKYVFAAALKLKEEAWLKISARFSYFFFFLALLNELIWRNFSEAFWVNFKLFGFGPLVLVFVLAQIPFIYSNQINKKE